MSITKIPRPSSTLNSAGWANPRPCTNSEPANAPIDDPSTNITMRTRIVGIPSVAATVGWSRIAMASRLAGPRDPDADQEHAASATMYTQKRLRSLVAASLVEGRSPSSRRARCVDSR